MQVAGNVAQQEDAGVVDVDPLRRDQAAQQRPAAQGHRDLGHRRHAGTPPVHHLDVPGIELERVLPAAPGQHGRPDMDDEPAVRRVQRLLEIGRQEAQLQRLVDRQPPGQQRHDDRQPGDQAGDDFGQQESRTADHRLQFSNPGAGAAASSFVPRRTRDEGLSMRVILLGDATKNTLQVFLAASARKRGKRGIRGILDPIGAFQQCAERSCRVPSPLCGRIACRGLPARRAPPSASNAGTSSRAGPMTPASPNGWRRIRRVRPCSNRSSATARFSAIAC